MTEKRTCWNKILEENILHFFTLEYKLNDLLTHEEYRGCFNQSTRLDLENKSGTD